MSRYQSLVDHCMRNCSTLVPAAAWRKIQKEWQIKLRVYPYQIRDYILFKHKSEPEGNPYE